MASYEHLAAFAREATIYVPTWPSESAATPTELLPLLAESLNVSNDQTSIATRNSSPTARAPITTQTRVDGQVSVNATYEGLEFFLTCAMGLEPHRIGGTLMPEELVVDEVYRHIIEIDHDLHAAGWVPGSGFIPGDGSPDGDNLIPGQRKMRRGTWYLYKGGNTWRIPSAMLSGLSFRANPQTGASFTANSLGYTIDHNYILTPALNTLTCFSVPMVFQDMTFEIGPVGFTQQVQISELSIDVGNQFRPVSTRTTGKFITEPRRPGFVPVTGSFTIPNLQDQSLQLVNATSDELSIVAQFTGPSIGVTGYNYQMTFYFPCVVLTSGDADTRGANKVIQRFQFAASNNGTNPMAFPSTTTTGSVFIEIINTNPDHSLL